ncbi:DUF551 domain-containing protein [Cronobacter sakazakii]|nr:DUF551 domain-containing protein [Cronobacter sakazakii]
MSEMSKEQDGNLRELCDDLKRWQGYYDPVDDKGQHEMFVRAADAVTELLALRKKREAAVPVAYISKADLDAGYPHILARKDYSKACPMAVFAAPPAQPVAVPEWTNEECFEFLSIAFRHAEIKGDFELDDLRLGVKMVNESRAAMLAAPVVSGWIPCSERMPEIGDEILYYCEEDRLRDCGIVSSSNFTGRGDAELFVHAEGYDLHFGTDITHWMPLPEAPAKN